MTGEEERPVPGGGAWWRTGLRSLITLCLLFSLASISRCTQPEQPTATSPTTAIPGETASGPAFLRIEVEPEGALILVDGLRSGTAPISLELPAGEHIVRAEMEGYEPLVWSVNLSAGSRESLTGRLVARAGAPVPTSTPEPGETPQSGQPLADLLIQRASIELEAGGLCIDGLAELGVRLWIENAGSLDAGPFVVEVNGVQVPVSGGLPAGQSTSLWVAGYVAGGENTAVVDAASQVPESNEGNNAFSGMLPIPTLPPPCTPSPATTSPPPAQPTETPQPTPAGAGPVIVREDRLNIATYPFASFLRPARNEALGAPYQVLDWQAYEASNPVPQTVSYRAVILENDYLALTFLPEVGGRLYEVLYKVTGHRETYRNPVLKPSPWGPEEQGWWLAAGGIEWCLPVEEHGYEWGVPWQLRTSRDDRGASVILRNTEAGDRVRAEIVVRLEANSSSFTIRPRLENPTNSVQAVKYWTNAMLAPGQPNAPSAELRFVLPQAVQSVTVHSRGDDFLPNYGERLSWPVHQGIDLSRLGNWNRWLGFFEDPAAGGFMAVYDLAYDEGMVRVFPDAASGAKVFAFGWNDPIAAGNWTDDASAYVEIHGGPAPTFDDSVSIPAGGTLEWSETWYPVSALGGLRYANAQAALNLSVGGGQIHVAAAATRPWSGQAILLLDGQERWRQAIILLPGQPLRQTLAISPELPAQGQLIWRLVDQSGKLTAEYTTDFHQGDG
jgi:hypothetical protein